MCTRVELLARLVESNVPVHTDSQHQEAQSSRSRDRLLVSVAFEVRICCNAVETVGPLGVEVNCRQEMLGDETSETPGM